MFYYLADFLNQAIWDCGSLDIDCIKNCIDATSVCYNCICEVLDYWWSKDAPNCFKKEIVSLLESSSSSDTGNETSGELLVEESSENGSRTNDEIGTEKTEL